MKQHYVLLLLSLLLISCSTDDNFKYKKAGTYAYSYFENKKIILSSSDNSYLKFGLVEPGTNLVFEYRFDTHDKPEIADDEYGETIRFEIQPEQKTFSYSDSELSKINIVYTKYCYCYLPKTSLKEMPPKGTIKGKKSSNKEWEIKMDVTFYGDEKKSFNEKFILKQ